MTSNSSGTYITEAYIKEREKKESPPHVNSPFKAAPKFIAKKESPDDREEYDRREKKWKQLLDKIQFIPNPPEYYQNLIIKPGFNFFKALITARFPLDNLKVNIPETIVCIDSALYFIYTDEAGHVQRKTDASYPEFEQKMNKSHEEVKLYCAELLKTKYHAKEAKDDLEYSKSVQELKEKKTIEIQPKDAEKKEKDKDKSRFDKLVELNELEEDKIYEKADKNEKRKIEATLKYFLKKIKKSPEMPFLIWRTPSGEEQNCSKGVLSFRAHKERKAGNIENNKFEQRFLFSKARRASIMRVVFHTRNSKSFNANYGIRITNFNYLCNEDTKNFQAKVAICTDKQDSFEINIVKGFGLAEYEVYCERVVTFLEKAYSVRVSEVVLDFINDIQDKIWLINMKSIKLETCVTRSDMQEGEGKKTLDELSCTVSCKLCGSFFKKDEANKVLTYKLLWELVQHLKKRGKPLQKIKTVSHSSTRPCRVCNTCYMLVVGEHELIEIEKSFAKFQNIPINDDEIRVPIDTKPKHRPALLSERLYQWRLLFFINEIQGIDSSMNLDFKNIYFHYKLHNFKTSFPVQSKFARTMSQDTIENSQINEDRGDNKKKNISKAFSHHSQSIQSPTYNKKLSLFVNMIRVHYFFSETTDIEKFLTDTEIKIRLSNGNNWNSFLAEGTSKTVSLFRNRLTGGQRHQSKVLCFFESANYCSLNLQAGLVCDGPYQTENLNLYKYNQIYFPDESFYNTNPFPPEWMEMFDPNSVRVRDEVEGMMDYEKYSPKCSPEDLKKMIDYEGYKGKSTMKGNEKMGRSQSAQRLTGKDPFQNKLTEYNSKNIRTLDSQNQLNQEEADVENENAMKFKLRPFTAIDGNKVIDPIQPIHRQTNQMKPKPKSSKPDLEYKSAQEVLLKSQAVRERTFEEQNVLKKYSVFDEEGLFDEDENPEMKGRQAYLIGKINKDMKDSLPANKNNSSTKEMNRSSQNFNNTSKTAKPSLPSVNSLKASNQVDSTAFKSYLNDKKSKVVAGSKGKLNEL